MLDGLWRDFAFAWRSLLRRPGYFLAAVATLALGIGANATMFGVVNAVLLAPLPYADPERLVAFHFERGDQPGERSPLSVADWQDAAPQFSVFAPAAVYVDNKFTLTGDGDAEQLRGVYGSGALFQTLGVAPLLGRTFVAGDDIPGNPGEVVLSHAFWERRYGAARDVIGKPIVLNGTPRPIIGVMPPGFEFPLREASGLAGPVALWARHPATPATRRGPYYLYGIGRMASGMSTDQVQAQLTTIASNLAREHPEHNANLRFASRPLKDQFVGSSRTTLYALFSATALVLLIAVVNVSNLLLSRGAARRREIAVRIAQGASSSHLLRHLFAEGVLLAGVGAVAGAGLGAFALRLLSKVALLEVPRLELATIDGAVLIFNAVVATACAIGFGLLPARRAMRMDTFDALRPSASSTATPESSRMRRALVGAEVALCFVVLVATGLLLRSLDKLQQVERGVTSPEQILSVGFYERLLERSAALPGVSAAGIGTSLPPNQLSITDNFEIDGYQAREGGEPAAPLLFVDGGYFKTLGIPLMRGRHFEAGDREGAPPVVMVNQAFSDRYFPGSDAIGKRMKVGGPERPENRWMEIVGVVGDVRYGGSHAAVEPAFYVPFRQSDWRGAYLLLRASGDAEALLAPVRRLLAEIDPELALFDARTMQQRFDDAAGAPRFRSLLFAAFGTLGLLLAAIGLYAVTATIVAERTREIGVRRALGATIGDVVMRVVSGAMRTTLWGLALGLLVALLATRLLEGLLFGLSALDPMTYLAAASLLLVTELLAAWVPARRAARADPLVALRDE
jgi:putative ABC transport system permease protein